MLRKNVARLLTCAFTLIVLMIGGLSYGQVPVPVELAVSPDQKYIPNAKPENLPTAISGLSGATAAMKVFKNGCRNGTFYAGFKLEFIPSNGGSEAAWTSAGLQIKFMDNGTTVWTYTLTVTRGQTYESTIFHNVPLSCDAKYTVKILSKPMSGTPPQGNIYFSTFLQESPSAASTAFDPNILYTLTPAVASGKTTLSWVTTVPTDAKNVIGYDLEWAYAGNEEGLNVATLQEVKALFERKAVRVTVPGPTYSHVPFYPSGKLWYRIRAVGFNSAYPNHRICGKWSDPVGPLTLTNPVLSKTWQEQVIYAEDGKYKKQLKYFDATLRERQSISTAADGNEIVGETMYDFEGRAAVQTLPTPVGAGDLTYRPSFNVFADATRKKVNYDNGTVENSVLSTTIGAGRYYSPANTYGANLKYIPNSEGYAYSQTQFTNDSRGLPTRTSSVGKELRIDGNHATRYFYGTPTPQELKSLFGVNVGKATHYKKNLVIDPNGQASVSYLDQEGRVIATALTGSVAPNNLAPLAEINDFATGSNIELSDQNLMTNGASKTTQVVLNVSPTCYSFTYSANAIKADLGSFGCKDCIYDLKIFITNPDGERVPLNTNGLCDGTGATSIERTGLSATCATNEVNIINLSFKAVFSSPGDYTVTKILTPREVTYDEVVQTVRTSVASKINDLVTTYNNTFSSAAISKNCDICNTSNAPPSVLSNAIAEIVAQDCANLSPSDCRYALCGQDQASTIFEKQLALINRWSEAKAKGYDVALSNVSSASTDPFFRSGGNGYASRATMQQKLDGVKIPNLKYDSGTDGIPDTDYPTASILLITDPNNTTYRITQDGKKSTSGLPVLYHDLALKKQNGQISQQVYDDEVDKQRWVLFKMFYMEAKRSLKMTLTPYSSCPAAMADLRKSDMPTTPAGIQQYGKDSQLLGDVTNQELQTSIYSIETACGITLSDAVRSSITPYLQSYFNKHPENFFRLILSGDLSSDSDLQNIQSILSQNGSCALASVAVANPFTCVKTASTPVNLVYNPYLSRNSGCSSNNITSSCFPGWLPIKGTPSTTSTGQSIKLGVYCTASNQSGNAIIRGSLISALVPGKKYRLTIKYSLVENIVFGLHAMFYLMENPNNTRSTPYCGGDNDHLDADSMYVYDSFGQKSLQKMAYIQRFIGNSTPQTATIDFIPTRASAYFRLSAIKDDAGSGAIQLSDIVISEINTETCIEYSQTNPTIALYSYSVDQAALNQAIQRCIDNANAEKQTLIDNATNKLLDTEVSNYISQHKVNCLANIRNETLNVAYQRGEYQYTLYYYDQAGNLVQTVPPKGVHPSPSGNPVHDLVTRYQYNSLNQLVKQSTPDAGESQFYYNSKGQLRFSNNSQQLKDKTYSYSRYDRQSRIVEVGEVAYAGPVADLVTAMEDIAWPGSAYTKTDVVKTFYDLPFDNTWQTYLRNRVSYTEVHEKGAPDVIATYYSYDIHGNVKSLVQQIPGLTGNKRIDYRYDLVSGLVRYAFFQYDNTGQSTSGEQFIHRYNYDSENRLVLVSTSSDGYVWDDDAKYSYYSHGPLARVELGNYRTQGLDYYYTLQGWIKGLNMPFRGDPGSDGLNAGNGNEKVGRDVMAYTLGYFQNDYLPNGDATNFVYSDKRDKVWTSYNLEFTQSKGLYNGNIAWMVTDLKKIGQNARSRVKGVQAMAYEYDQLNRLVNTTSLADYFYDKVNGNSYFSARTNPTGPYDEEFIYDQNGNMKSLKRRDHAGGILNDFAFTYYHGTNKLRYNNPVTTTKTFTGAITTDNKLYSSVTFDAGAYVPTGTNAEVKAVNNIDFNDGFSTTGTTNIGLHAYIVGSDEGTYNYDAIGNLVADQEQGTVIQWTPYGKVRQVSASDGTLVTFRYDASGNRIEKKLTKNNTTTITRYVRDASGNVMAVYSGNTISELSIYGSSRIGQYTSGRAKGTRQIGAKTFELSNHLGNVLAVVSDQVHITTDSAWVDVTRTMDYYAFGSTMTGRDHMSTGYRYGFNGKEKDSNGEWGSTAHYDYGFRIYNPSIGRFLSVDPLTKSYPWYTPYQFAGNKPIVAVDVDGLEEAIVIKSKWYEAQIGTALKNGDAEEAIRLAYEAIDDPAKNKFAEKMYGGKYAAQWRMSGTLPSGISIVGSNGIMHTQEIPGQVVGDPENSFEFNIRLSYGPAFGAKFKLFGIGQALEGSFTKELITGKLDKSGFNVPINQDKDSPWRLKSGGQFAALPIGIGVTRDFTSEGVVKSEGSLNIGFYETSYDAISKKASGKFKVFDVSYGFGLGKIETDFSFSPVGYKAYQDPTKFASDATRYETGFQLKMQVQKPKK